ncbi:MAG: hypothetical protein ACP5L1_06210 [Caldivirga sp.]|uniref:hypothetical protein n=1 Tax=Caldivirga sp. TaxID=2080243 RepID=UPI003D145BDB
MLRIGKVTETKRAFVAFLRPEFIKWIRASYLPRREVMLKMITPGIVASGFFTQDVIEAIGCRLIPFEQSRLRREIKENS